MRCSTLRAGRRILDKLTGLRHGESSSPYRFIVATRPLPSTEFPEESRWPILHYELQPFAAGQLTEFAERWFTELKVAQPRRAARTFVSELGRTHLADPARTPLMATMLCQLFAINPGRPLPAGRSGAYAEFVELLQSRQYTDNTSGIYTQMQATLSPYGPAATGLAAELLTVAMDLIARLALARQDGDDGPAVDLLSTWTAGRRPRHVPDEKWRSFLREILRRSGLLTQRADDFQFIHQTVGEFLAARHLVADATRSPEVFRVLFEQWVPPQEAAAGAWVKPGWDDSYSRFIVAAWPDKPRLTMALHRLATDGGLDGCQFIASLATDMAVPARSVVDSAMATLTAIAENSFREFPVRHAACEVLTQLGDCRGADLLAAMAADPALNPASRRQAAEALARLGDDRSADLLAAQATDPALEITPRLWAAQVLARLGDGRGTDLLAAMATDPALSANERGDAAEALARIADRRSTDLLATIAANRTLKASACRQLARALARLGDPRGADLLAAMATDLSSEMADRRLAAAALLQVSDGRDTDRLAALAAHPDLDDSSHLNVAQHLALIRDDRGPGLLAALAADPARRASSRSDAAWFLALINDGRGADLLAALAADPALSSSMRKQAVRYLGELADPRRSRQLAMLPVSGDAGQPTTGLPRRPDRGAVELLAALAADQALDYETRSTAALMLVRLGDRRGALLRRILISADSSVRGQAAEALGRHSGYRAAELLAALALDLGADVRHPEFFTDFARQMHALGAGSLSYVLARGLTLEEAFDPWSPPLARGSRDLDEVTRRRAAEALARLGDPRGLDLLAAMGVTAAVASYAYNEARHTRRADDLVPQAAMADLMGSSRLEVAEALARCGDPRGADLLDVMASAGPLPARTRTDAAEALARLGDPRGGDLLARRAVDATAEPGERGDAAEALARLGDARHADALAVLAADVDLDGYTRLELAEALARCGDPRAADVLAGLASGASVLARTRIDAAEALARFGDPRGSDLLVGLATTPVARAARGLVAEVAEVLARLADPGHADVLAGLAADAHLDGYTRLEVAEGLARRGDPRGADLLAALAADSSLNDYLRRWADGALAEIAGSGEGFTGRPA